MDALRKRFKLARISTGKAQVRQHLEPLLPASAPGHTTSTSHDTSNLVAEPTGPAPVKQSRTKQMVFLFGSCCGGQRRSSRPKRERKHRRSKRERKHHLHATSRTPVQPEVPGLQVAPLAATSIASGRYPAACSMLVMRIVYHTANFQTRCHRLHADSEYHDAREAWSVGDLGESFSADSSNAALAQLNLTSCSSCCVILYSCCMSGRQRSCESCCMAQP